MNTYIIFGIIFLILLVLELLYFKIADRFNIIDKPNERSSHSTIVLRGGGIVFALSLFVWAGVQMVNGDGCMVQGYWPFIAAVTLVAGVSFVDDIKSLPDSSRLVAQFVAMAMMFWNIGLFEQFQVSGGFSVSGILVAIGVLVLLVAFVGAADIYNFMDGINGITGAYAMAVLVPLALLNGMSGLSGLNGLNGLSGFVDQSLIYTVMIADVVFCLFNFRPKGKAKCFAGDVGSIGVAYILLFLIGKVIIRDLDVTYLVFLVLYGLDGVITIGHRIMLHEHLGEAHRKHSYQLMANELKMSHVTVSLIYAVTQLAINLVFIYLVPDTVAAHWMYLFGVIGVFGTAILLFRKKYYHLHEEYLESLRNK